MDRSFAVQGQAERIDHPADERGTGRNLHDPVRPLNLVSLLDEMALSQENGPDAFFLQIQGQPEDILGELQKFIVHDPVEPENSCDPVADGGDGSDFADIDIGFVALNLLLDNFCDLIGFDIHDQPTLR